MGGGDGMEFSTYLPILFLWLLIFSDQSRRRKTILMQQILKQVRKEDAKMFELAKKFIGKECTIYAMDNRFEGNVEEVTDNAILIEKNGSIEVINLNFVIRIKENCKKRK